MITSRHRRHLWLFTIAVLALFFYLIRFTFWNIPQASSDQQEFQQEQQTTRRKRIPLILGYTKWFGADMFSAALENGGACAHDVECEFTDDRQRLRDADAVVIHPRDITVDKLPAHMHARQRFVLITSESPLVTVYDRAMPLRASPAHYYNLTITYRHDSDCARPYGGMQARASPLIAESNTQSPTNKTKMVVWMSSACTTPSRRERVVEALRKAGVPVDVWGTCGDALACPKSRMAECLHRIDDEYTFYLAFENAVCRDYVSEKLWSRLRLNAVPIVLVRSIMAHSGLPNEAFIAVDDFDNVSELAAHLHYVHTNHTAYAAYFDYRRTHEPMSYAHAGFCCLCRLLHNDDMHSSSSYDDISKWFNGAVDCKSNWHTLVE